MLAFKIFLGVLGAGFMGAIMWCCSLMDKQNRRLEEVERRMELYEHLQDDCSAKTTKNGLQLGSLADAVDVLTNRLNLLYDYAHGERDATELSVDNLIGCCNALHDKLKDQQRSIDYLYNVNEMFSREQLALEEKMDQTALDICNRLTRVEDKLGLVQWVNLEDDEECPEEGFEGGTEPGTDGEKVSSKQGTEPGTDGDFESEKALETPE